jgi:hypothetical protein
VEFAVAPHVERLVPVTDGAHEVAVVERRPHPRGEVVVQVVLVHVGDAHPCRVRVAAVVEGDHVVLSRDESPRHDAITAVAPQQERHGVALRRRGV